MAGNFWQSSHFQQWLLDKQDLIRERQHDLGILTEEEYQKIFIFFANFIQVLGEQLKLRQQVIATATVYLKRFYARNSLGCIDPLLLAPTCVFLASKVEEFGVISNSRLISTCQTVVKNKLSYAYTQEFPYRTNHVLECEFYLLENLDCCLIVYQPYRPLLQLLHDVVYAHSTSSAASGGGAGGGGTGGGAGGGGGGASGAAAGGGSGNSGHPSPHHHHHHHHSGGTGATPPSHPSSAHAQHSSHPSAPNSGSAAGGGGGGHQGHGGGGGSSSIGGAAHGEEQLLALAWRVANDSLRTDLSLLYPPYQIALGCLQIACVIMQRDLKTWFAELNVDMDKIQEICRCLVSLFELWKSYDEKKDIQALLAKMPKPKSQPTSRSPPVMTV